MDRESNEHAENSDVSEYQFKDITPPLNPIECDQGKSQTDRSKDAIPVLASKSGEFDVGHSSPPNEETKSLESKSTVEVSSSPVQQSDNLAFPSVNYQSDGVKSQVAQSDLTEEHDKSDFQGKTFAQQLNKEDGNKPLALEDQNEEESGDAGEPHTPLSHLVHVSDELKKDNQNQVASLTSSPITPSVSGQDSGISQDECSSDTPKSPIEEGTDIQGEIKPEDNKVSTLQADVKTGDESVIQHQRTVSPDNNTSVSETQITVSDIDTPSTISSTLAGVGVAGATALEQSEHESVYYIKWIMFGQNSVPIITQNENGPCPLLAIMNVLLLKGKVKLAPMLEMITSEQLMTYLGECIFENMPKNLSETTQANYEQNMQDAMGVMYKLQTGLDVNVRFTGVGDFEYTPELIIFDLLEISLYHGWLVDPQDPETVKAVNQCSYNQLVEKIISLKNSDQEEEVMQALISEQFLDRSASQLTYHGLCELSSVVKENELCVFFRNNHFSTLYKQNNELFLLVTDQGFLTESDVVWETLSNVDGDCHFTDATFRTYTKPSPSTDPIPDPCVPVGSPEQIDHDYQVALFLQEEANQIENPAWVDGFQQEHAAFSQADHEFALRLQEEENRRAIVETQRGAPGTAHTAQTHSQGQGRYQSQGPPSENARRRGERGDKKEEKSCSVL